MAQLIQRPLLGVALQRLLRLTGPLKLKLEDFVVPVIQVGQLSESSEPPIRRTATAEFSQAAVAAQFGIARFEVPPGTLGLVRAIQVRSSVAAEFIVNFPGNAATITPATTATPKVFTDGRLITLGEDPAGVLTHGTSVAGLGPLSWRSQLVAGASTLIEPTNWICGTGDPTTFGFIEFALTTALSAFDMALQWEEFAIF